MRKLNLTGQIFGRITVLKDSENRDKQGNILWKCKCDCGKTVEISSKNLRLGNTQSCGCLQREKARKWAKKLSEKIMDAWIAFARYGNPNHSNIPEWSVYDIEKRATMMMGQEFKVVNAPYEKERERKHSSQDHRGYRNIANKTSNLWFTGPSANNW